MGINQAMVDSFRNMNTRQSGAAYDPNMPIPRPGQPTNYQMTPLLGSYGPYVNQDIAAFNGPQQIPMPGRPAYTMPQAQQIPGGTPMDLTDGGPTGQVGNTAAARARTASLIGGLLAQQPSPNIPMQQMAPQQQQQPMPMGPPGYYGRQAMGMAGLPPNGLLGGGKGTFRPGGK